MIFTASRKSRILIVLLLLIELFVCCECYHHNTLAVETMTLGFSVSPALHMDLFSDESDPLAWRDSDVMFSGMQHYPLISDDQNKQSAAQDVDLSGLGGGDLNSIYQTPHQYENGPKYCDRLLANRLNSSFLSTAYDAERGEGRVGRGSPSVVANTLRANVHQNDEIDHEQLLRDYRVPAHGIRAQGDVVPLVSSRGCNSNPSTGAQITDQVENQPDLSGGLPYHPAFEGSYAIQFGSSFSAMDVLLGADQSPAKTAIQTHALYPYVVAAHIDCYKIGAEPADLRSMEQATLKHHHLQPQNNSFRPSPDTKQELDNVLAGYTRMLVDLKEKMEESFFGEKQWCNEVFEKLRLLGPSSSPTELTGSEAEVRTSTGGKEGCPSVIGDTMQESPFWDDRNGLIAEDVKRAKIVKEWLRRKHDRSQIYQLRGQCKRKRRQGKHSQTARERLVEWFERHGEWPYPSEEEKLKLAEQTKLETRQINNWFINQRKRHWDSPSKEETNLQVENELKSQRQVTHREKVKIDTFYFPLDVFNPSHNANFS